MQGYKYIILVLLTLGGLGNIVAQVDDDPVEDNPDEQLVIESLLEGSDQENLDLGTQFEYLEAYLKNPIDLNNATQEELTDFGMLSAIQIQGLLLYRKKLGQIYSLYELQGVPTFDPQTIQKLLPYVTVSATQEMEKMNFKRMFTRGRHEVYLRYIRILEKQKGYIPNEFGDSTTKYLGSPDKFYARYRMKYRDRMSLGITMEKDPGEEFFKGSNKQGFDFYSGHFYLKNLSKNVHSVALGDFNAYFGQGLTMWGGFGSRKSTGQVLNIKRNATSIRPFTSANEALFLRGAAASFRFLKESNLEVTAFGSFRQRDVSITEGIDSIQSLEQLIDFLANYATLYSDPTDGAIAGSSTVLNESGFHRTDREVERENTTNMITSGARIRYSGTNWHIAGNVVHTYFTTPLFRGNPNLYQKYDFSGQSLLNASLDYSYNYKNLQFFGETAIDDKAAVATVNGVLANLDPRINIAILHRYYSYKYRHLNGNAFGESARTNNESGLYLGVESNLGAGLKFSGYFDIFQSKWLSYQADAPARGYEYVVRLDYNLSYTSGMYLQYRFEQKDRNLSANETKIDYLIPNKQHRLRYHFSYNVNSQLSLRSRIEFSWTKDNLAEHGFMLYQDIVYKPKFIPLKFNTRLAFFNTQGWDSRIYAYENDMLTLFTVGAFANTGLRYYFNLSYKINNMFTVWLKFSQTYFMDTDEISSGLNQIDGPVRSEIKAQVRMKF